MNRIIKGAIVAAISLSALATTNAQVVLSESFTYADGPLVGAAGSPWTTSSGTAGQQNVAGGRLFIDDNESEDTVALFSSAVTFGSVSAIFDLQMDPADIVTNATGNYITSFVGSNGNLVGRVFMITNPGGPAGTFRIGISTGSATPNAIFTSVFTAGTTYSLSLSYDLTTNLATLSSSGFGSITSTDAVDNNNINRFGFRQDTTHGDVFIDNLAVTAIPEPATYMLFGIGLLACAQRFRRSKGKK